MPLKLNIGLSRKVGEANYGSRGASVHVELEVDSSVATEPGKLQEKIRAVFNLVRASVNEELNGGNGNNGHSQAENPPPPQNNNNNGNGQGSGNVQSAANGQSPANSYPPANNNPPTNGNGQSNGNGYRQPSNNSNGNGQRQGNNGTNRARQATASQVRAIRAITNRLKINLDKLLGDRFQIGRPEELTLRAASNLIDELNSEGK